MQAYNSRHHTLILLKDFLNLLKQGVPFNQDSLEEEDQGFLDQLSALISALDKQSLDANFDGQDWLTRLFRNYPTYAPHLGREVLWYFGGEALHFMPDPEIEKFQALDDMVAEGRDYLEAKIEIFNAK
jgi:hypothetical protein